LNLPDEYDPEIPDDGQNKFVEISPDKKFSRFVEEIGRGAHKTVYLGWDNEEGREVAWNNVKFTEKSKECTNKIANEIRLLKNLEHHNIINLLGAWLTEDKNAIIFITEICQGGSLKFHMKKFRNLRKKIIKKWCRGILQGLQYLHDRDFPVVHRDIKCDNIFINSNDGEIILGDFGFAATKFDNNKGSVVGTPEFMAPEIFDEDYDKSVDIYAFGMCIIEMVSGETPYSECKGNPMQVFKKISQEEKPKVLERIADEDIKIFIDKCLAKRDDRPSASELLVDPFLKDYESDILNINILPDPDKEAELEKKKGLKEKRRKSRERRQEDSREKEKLGGCEILLEKDDFFISKEKDCPLKLLLENLNGEKRSSPRKGTQFSFSEELCFEKINLPDQIAITTQAEF
jgi:WNK lysine deficient protein kinase